jgi:hypothetical protein
VHHSTSLHHDTIDRCQSPWDISDPRQPLTRSLRSIRKHTCASRCSLMLFNKRSRKQLSKSPPAGFSSMLRVSLRLAKYRMLCRHSRYPCANTVLSATFVPRISKCSLTAHTCLLSRFVSKQPPAIESYSSFCKLWSICGNLPRKLLLIFFR